MRSVLLAGTLAVITALATAAPAAADCPPLGSAANWMERFMATYAGRSPSREDIQEFRRRQQASPLLVLPTTGPVPLEIGIAWLYLPVETPAKIEIAPDGGAAQPWAPPWTVEQGGRRTFTYDRPGRYDLTVWLQEASGRATRSVTPIVVSTPADFDAELRG